VEVRRRVIVMIHANDDTEEEGNDRHLIPDLDPLPQSREATTQPRPQPR
jgi:hypothetical protein